MRGKFTRKDIAAKINCTLSQLSYLSREKNLQFHSQKHVTNPNLVQKVVAYYRAHGKPKTRKKFPQVSVRSIVEHYGNGEHNRAQPWNARTILEAARMGGLVPYDAQSMFLKRPNAHAGSIHSFWAKRVGRSPGHLHGIPVSYAMQICRGPLKTVRVKGNIRTTQQAQRKLVLWVDMLGHVRCEMPQFIHDAVVAMAGFQYWLYNSDNPRAAILRLQRQRA